MLEAEWVSTFHLVGEGWEECPNSCKHPLLCNRRSLATEGDKASWSLGVSELWIPPCPPATIAHLKTHLPGAPLGCGGHQLKWGGIVQSRAAPQHMRLFSCIPQFMPGLPMELPKFSALRPALMSFPCSSVLVVLLGPSLYICGYLHSPLEGNWAPGVLSSLCCLQGLHLLILLIPQVLT